MSILREHNTSGISVKFDITTASWFEMNPGTITTVTKCGNCGLFYKPSLGHKCRYSKKSLKEG